MASEAHDAPDRTATARLAVGVLAVGVLGFLACYVFVAARWSPMGWLDSTAVVAMAELARGRGAWVDALVAVATVFAPWTFRGLGLVVAVVLFRRGRRRLAVWLAGAVAGGTLLVWGLKPLIARPRPSLAVQVVVERGYGFPSGHAFASALVVGAFLLLVLQAEPGPRTRVLAWTGALLLVAVVGFDRIALDVHHVSDVLGAWFLAAAVLGAAMLGYSADATSAAPLPEPSPRNRVGVILNPVRVEDVAGFRFRLNQLAALAGWRPPLWFETTADDQGRAAVRAALRAGVDLVVVAGGDGTVRVVCGELAGSGVQLGIVPAGTGNLLCRNLGIPLDHEAAIRVALEGEGRRIDLARVGGDGLGADRFAVMAGLGLDAAIVGAAADRLKTRVGWPAYVVSAVRNLSFPAVSMEIRVDDEPPVRRRARTVVIGNVGTLTGGLPLLPQARPDDGLLDVVVLAPRVATDWPGLVWRVVRRAPPGDERLAHWRGRRVFVRASEPCPRQLDGDVIPRGRELRVEIDPGSLVIRVPRGPEPPPTTAAAEGHNVG